LFPNQAIQQAGLADVAPTQKSYFREGVSRKLIRLGCTHYKLRVHQALQAPTPLRSRLDYGRVRGSV
jgi:hypothetical protein